MQNLYGKRARLLCSLKSYSKETAAETHVGRRFYCVAVRYLREDIFSERRWAQKIKKV
jgi:hypothetical protein